MKTIRRKPLIQILLLLVIVEAFYFFGKNNVFNPPAARAATDASTVAAKNPGAVLTANEAKNRFLAAQEGRFPPEIQNTPDRQNMLGLNISIVQGVKLQDIPDLITMLNSAPAWNDRDQLINMLMGRLKKENPDAVSSLLASMAASLPDSPQRDEAILASIRSLATSNPKKVLSELAKLPPGALAQNAYRVAFGLMVHSNPANALAALNDLPAGLERDAAMQGVADVGVGSSDPKAVLDWLSRLPPEDAPVLNEALMNLAAVYHKIGLAAEYVANIPDPAERNDVIMQIAGYWGAEPDKNPAAALDWLNQAATGDTYTQAVTKFFASLANKDSATAASLLGKVTDPAVLETAITNIASGWGKTDPQAALTWAQTLPDTVSANAVNSIVAGWSKSDSMAAASFVESSPDPSAFLSDDPTIAESLAVADPQAALTFADTMHDGEAKSQVLNNVLVTFAKTDFTIAWTDAAALPAVDNPIGIMTNLVSALASKDPAQAAGLISQFPAGTAQDNVTGTVASTWVSLDPQAFTVWLTSLQPGDVRDTAIAQLAASSQATKNPAGVLEWVNTVTNPQTKAALLQKLVPTQTGAAP